MRGVVSLAAALALPTTLPDGSPFPGRDVIVGVTVVVIAMTLLLQGATLQPLVRLLGIPVDNDSEAELHHGRERILAVGIERLDRFCTENECPLAVHK